MRTNNSGWARSLWSVVVAIAAIGLAASDAAAQTAVHLIAAPVMKAITLPNGGTVSVPMWGYAVDVDDSGTVNGSEVVSVPGPRIVAGAGTLTVTLTNLLPEPTSLVIPGQPFAALAADPARNADGRARSMTPETAVGATGTYTFPNVKTGTFLYQSGSHPAVQVQMGLYGAMTKDQAAGVAYAGVSYDHEVLLVYSEIDQGLHEAVNAGTYGTVAGPTSTINYTPSLFLINGESYTAAMAASAAGTAGQVTLLRMLNAGLRTHVPQLDNGTLSIVAEDGNKLPFSQKQSGVMLAAGKTHDALWTPSASGVYSLYDRTLGLNARGPGAGQGSAGMLAKLRVDAAGAVDPDAPVAGDDSFTGFEDCGIATCGGPAIAGSVVGGDLNYVSFEQLTSPRGGVLTFTPGGDFTYTPNQDFFGFDSFTYRVHGTSSDSSPAVVTLAITGMPDAPVASTQAFGVDQNGNASVTLSGTDADGDALAYYLTSVPGNGALSYIDPITKIDTPLDATNLRSGTAEKAIPGGLVIYTPTATYFGADSFNFVAFDGASDSAPAEVSATVHQDESSVTSGLTTPIMLTVMGSDGTTISNYRWTLEEDLTYKVEPGLVDSNTLSVRFHTSYMPVVATGTDADQIMVDPVKRYFISVLPTVNNYSNGGAGIEVGQTEVKVTSAKLPLPTARIRVEVFQDNAPLDGIVSGNEPGLAGFQVTFDDAGGTYGMSGGHQSTDAFGNKIGTTYLPCPDANPCDHAVDRLGDGFILTDAAGIAVIENLPMGKYTVKVRAPGGDRWIQTTTIEGQPGIDAWVKPNEPQFFTEFGPPGAHVFVGFTRAVTGAGVLATTGGARSTITGRVTNLRQSRVPAVAQFSGAPFTHTRAWVALNSAATAGSLLFAQPTNEDGTFSIANVPSGSYQLVVFDSALDLIIGNSVVVVVGGTPKNVGDVATFSWFTNLYSFVFDDKNRDGIHQADEPGIPDQALNIRFRDGSIYQSLSTDDSGFKAFNEVFPFFAWMIAEVDYTRYHSTGLTVVTDDGGDSGPMSPNYGWRDLPGIELPADVKRKLPAEALNPQPQPDNSNLPFRNESGAATPFLLLEGFQSFIGQSTVMLWGKAPYEAPGSFVEDVDVAPFGDFPGPGDIDDGDGFFNTDRSNGGIAGIVHYTITRAENDPRWATAENWEAGVSDVTIQLWDATRTHKLNEAATDNFNNSQPDGCQWNQPFSYLGNMLSATRRCFDGLRVFNQARPALFDGGYAFSTILVDSYDPAHPEVMTFNLPLDQRQAMRPIPAAKYVVKMVPPPGYKVQKEEDKNVDFGDLYVPQRFWINGLALADAAEPPVILASLAADITSTTATSFTVGTGEGRNLHPNNEINVDAEVMRVTAVVGDTIGVLRGQANSSATAHLATTGITDHGAQPAATVTDNALIAPFCVGTLHVVPDEFTLFPGLAGPYGGEMKPLCDAKLVNLRVGQQAAPDFHLLTDAPKAGQIFGMVLDDTTNEFDPNAPTFGEKYAPPFLSIAIRDWQGREITRTYSDQYGRYNALVPATYTIQVPQPSGVSPSILAACINSPTMPGPGGSVIADPHFQKQYSHFCYPLQYLPGKTTYLDTPVLPTGAFTGNGTFPVDAELPNHTPVIASVTGPDPATNVLDATNPYGPYIVDRGAANAAARTIVIRSAASMTADHLTEVPNPAYDGAGGLQPKLISRDYGFGSGGIVRVGATAIPAANVTWGNEQITAIVPTGVRTGELSVARAGAMFCALPVVTPLSTLAADASASAGVLTVAFGGGKLFTVGGQIQVDSEVMLVTVRNDATLAATGGAMTNSATNFGGRTMRVVNGQGANFTAAPFTLPTYASIDNEIIYISGKSSTALTAASGTSATGLISVTAGTGYGTIFSVNANRRFEIGDVLTITSALGTEQATVLGGTTANNYLVTRPGPRFNHLGGTVITANDRFNVLRARAGSTIATHANSASVFGDQLATTRAQAGTLAAYHSVPADVSSYTPGACTTSGSIQSILGVTLSVATVQMHTAQQPVVVSPGGSIQAAIDTATPGQLILVKPGTYEQMVVMSKPVRLQGAGALMTAVNVVTTPAENLQAWLDNVGNLLLSNSYNLPSEPAMTPAPFQPGDVAAVVGDEGSGVLVLGKNQLSAAVGGGALENAITGIFGPLGTCLPNGRGVAFPLANTTARNFGAPMNEAYCLQNENYTNGTSTAATAAWRPNARIDGFSLIGASHAPGVLVNGYARYLEVSNNKIFTNSGTFAGGIQVGHAGAVVPINNDDAENDNVAIHNNMVAQNASTSAGGGGGIVLGTGTNNYVVKNNFIAANLSSGNGGGVAHVGLSPSGEIDSNTVIFNESFTQGTGTNGGGIFIGGTPPAAGAVTLGTGPVTVRNNLVQGNAASGGDGGGIALLGFAPSDRVGLYNNVIANNLAGLAGGGISIEGLAPAAGSAVFVDITHNTVVENTSSATAGAAFLAPLVSTAQPAGIAGRGDMAHVRIANSIVWHNRTFYFGQQPAVPFCGDTTPPNTPPCSIVPVGPGPPPPVPYGEIIDPARTFWDLGVLGGTQFSPMSSVISGLTAATAYAGPGSNNTSVQPAFVASYFNTDRRHAYQATEITTLINVPAALDEGGNFIRPQFGPLSLENPITGLFNGNYHVTLPVGNGVSGAALGSLYTTVPGALTTDFDQQVRPVATPHRGADQVISPVAVTPVPPTRN